MYENKKILKFCRPATWIFLFLGLFFFQVGTAQDLIPEKPLKQTSVYDYIDLLSSSQRSKLEKKLIRYSDTTSTQIVIVIIRSTRGENISYLAANWGEKWGIGQAGKDNGVLILMAKDDRKVTIATGKGIEHVLTDFMSRRIIKREIIPEFKRENFYEGLYKGTDAIFEALNGAYTAESNPPPSSSSSKKGKGLAVIVISVIAIIFMIVFRFRRRLRRMGSGRSIVEGMSMSNAGRRNVTNNTYNTYDSFSGGFGGGSFGGGGATGSW